MEFTFKGVVYPAHTDAMGHMTVQFYIAAFDQAFWHLVASLGYNPGWREERQEGWADVRHEIDYRAELKVGDLFTVESTVNRVGSSSLMTRHVLRNFNNEICSEMMMISVYYDLLNRVSKPIPGTIKSAASALVSAPSPL
ncbi:hypothetical protein PS874_06107 [Pseudomonas fluorescens]|nr:hypothetical protein PS874_06107 [Pseudomonas fluorescens]